MVVDVFDGAQTDQPNEIGQLHFIQIVTSILIGHVEKLQSFARLQIILSCGFLLRLTATHASILVGIVFGQRGLSILDGSTANHRTEAGEFDCVQLSVLYFEGSLLLILMLSELHEKKFKISKEMSKLFCFRRSKNSQITDLGLIGLCKEGLECSLVESIVIEGDLFGLIHGQRSTTIGVDHFERLFRGVDGSRADDALKGWVVFIANCFLSLPRNPQTRAH